MRPIQHIKQMAKVSDVQININYNSETSDQIWSAYFDLTYDHSIVRIFMTKYKLFLHRLVLPFIGSYFQEVAYILLC